MVASSDEHFREMVRDNLLNIPNAKVVAEYQEVSPNLYIRVLQDLERHPEAGADRRHLGRPRDCAQVPGTLKQAVPDLYVIVSNYHADGETVIAVRCAPAPTIFCCSRSSAPISATRWRAGARPAARRSAESKLGKVYTFLGTKGGVGTTTLAVNFAAVLAQRKQHTVLSIWTGPRTTRHADSAPQPQYTLSEVAENLDRMDQALFEGFVTRDPLGFFLVGPPIRSSSAGYFTETHVPRVHHVPGGEVRRHRDGRGPRPHRRSGRSARCRSPPGLPRHRRRSSPPFATRSATWAT